MDFFVNEYQTLIAGIIGFAGVTFSMILNGWLSRKQQQENIEHKKSTIKAAIIAELKINFSAYDERVQQLIEPSLSTHGEIKIPKKAFTDVYKSLLDQVGILDLENVECIINTYLLLEEFPDKISLLSNHVPDDSPYIRFEANQRDNLANLHKYYAKELKTVIKKLSVS